MLQGCDGISQGLPCRTGVHRLVAQTGTRQANRACGIVQLSGRHLLTTTSGALCNRMAALPGKLVLSPDRIFSGISASADPQAAAKVRPFRQPHRHNRQLCGPASRTASTASPPRVAYPQVSAPKVAGRPAVRKSDQRQIRLRPPAAQLGSPFRRRGRCRLSPCRGKRVDVRGRPRPIHRPPNPWGHRRQPVTHGRSSSRVFRASAGCAAWPGRIWQCGLRARCHVRRCGARREVAS